MDVTRRQFIGGMGAAGLALGLGGWGGGLSSALSAMGGTTGEEPPAPGGGLPHLIFIVTDDMPLRAVGPFARPEEGYLHGGRPVLSSLSGGWTNFRRHIVPHSVCGPSRATTLSGKYSHHHGVVKNSFKLIAQADQSDWLPAVLGALGYRTWFMGKYSFGKKDKAIPRPPGMEVWMPGGGRSSQVFPAAEMFIRNAPDDRPLALFIFPTDPHRPYVVEAGYKNAAIDVPPPTPPCYIDDFSDWPSHMRRNRRFTDRKLKGLGNNKEAQVGRVLLGMDDGLKRVIGAMQATGRWDNTLGVFASDNGYYFGELGIRAGKDNPYRPATNVPLLVHMPGQTGDRDEYGIVGGHDVAPTVAALLGASMPHADGRDFSALLTGAGGAWENDVYIAKPVPTAKAFPRFGGVYAQWGDESYTYVRYDSGEEELFDLVADPWQLQSVHRRPEYAVALDALRARTGALAL